jgi:acyl dehydratase
MTEIREEHGTIDGRGGVYDIFVGKDLGWADVDTGPSAIDRYVDITGDDHPWYRGDSPFGGPLVPATFLHFRAFEHNPGWFPENQYGTLFAGISLDWNRPLLAGEPIRSHAWVSDIQRKGQRWHISCDVDVYDDADRIALHTRTTQTFLVDDDFRGVVRSKANERPPRASRLGARGTTTMEPFHKDVTQDMCVKFFGGSKNYHTDAEESSKMGFDDIVVGGPMSVCYIGDMLTKNLGASLFSGGRLAIRFVDILWPNMEIQVVGSRAEQPIEELGRQRYDFDLEVQDATGRVTVVATGSHVLQSGQGGLR